MKISTKKIIILSLAFYVLITALSLVLQIKGVIRFEPVSKEYTITITEAGFTPDELTIRKGDIVHFKNEDADSHWPASNPHPIHDIYSQFDPKTAILPNTTWSFQLNKTGEWHYHDHMIPYNTGVILVEP